MVELDLVVADPNIKSPMRGFFCNFISELQIIISFFNEKHRLPESIDSSGMFTIFKDNADINLSNILFEIKENDIIYETEITMDFSFAWNDYKNINFKYITPFINKYFSPSNTVKLCINNFINKYNIDFENTAYVLYRGNDKVTEMKIATYDEFITQAKLIRKNNPTIKFLIQTDELEFRETFINYFGNCFYFDELPVIKKNIQTNVHHTLLSGEKQNFSINLLSSIRCGSNCKYIINHTGNVGLWAILYRSNTHNTFQYINSKWI